MGLTSSLTNAVSGLRSIETGLETVSRNIASAGVEGYARRRVQPVELSSGSVIAADVQRELDVVVQRHMRAEAGAAAYTGVAATFLGRLDQNFGVPGGAGSLDTLYNGFGTALQALESEPANATMRQGVTSAAEALAGGLNRIAGDVATMRRDADAGLAEAVSAANAALATLEASERELTFSRSGNARADILDVRDKALDTLAGLLDIRVSPRGDGAISVYTAGGAALFTGEASRLAFSQGEAFQPGGAGGAVRLVGAEGGETVLDQRWLRSGQIAGLLAVRDTILPGVAASIDSIAAGLADAGNKAGLALFVDAGNGTAAMPYAGGAQEQGFGGRIALDPALRRDPTALSPGGAPAMPRALLDALGDASRPIASPDGSGTIALTLGDGVRHLLDRQGAMAANAGRVNEGQVTVLNGLRERFAEGSGVSVDQEMAQLVSLQNAYAANARIIAVVQSMYDALLRI